MSWTGLKKAASRAGTTIFQKTGSVERTVDSEFADESARFKLLEKNTLALQKEAKAYLDAVRQLSASSTRIAATIDSFYGSDSGEQAMAANAYKRAVEEMERSVGGGIDAPYRSTVLDPIGRLCSYWPEVNNHITKRNKKLLDYDSARARAKKTSDKPGEAARAEQEEQTAREVFEAIDTSLKAELPVLLDLRVPYLDPSFEAMIRMQVHFARDGYEKLGGVQRYFPETVRDDYAAGSLDAQVEGCLQEMRDLSICAAHA